MPVGVWAVVVAGLMVSRLPTLSFKTVRVPARLVAPLLVMVGLAAAVLVTVPFLGLGIVALVYLATIPYTMHRHRWLAEHPEAWNVPMQERRALVRSARSARRLGLRSPLRRRVAGRASAMPCGPRGRRPGRTNVTVAAAPARAHPATACASASAAPAAAAVRRRVSVSTTPSRAGDGDVLRSECAYGAV